MLYNHSTMIGLVTLVFVFLMPAALAQPAVYRSVVVPNYDVNIGVSILLHGRELSTITIIYFRSAQSNQNIISYPIRPFTETTATCRFGDVENSTISCENIGPFTTVGILESSVDSSLWVLVANIGFEQEATKTTLQIEGNGFASSPAPIVNLAIDGRPLTTWTCNYLTSTSLFCRGSVFLSPGRLTATVASYTVAPVAIALIGMLFYQHPRCLHHLKLLVGLPVPAVRANTQRNYALSAPEIFIDGAGFLSTTSTPIVTLDRGAACSPQQDTLNGTHLGCIYTTFPSSTGPLNARVSVQGIHSAMVQIGNIVPGTVLPELSALKH